MSTDATKIEALAAGFLKGCCPSGKRIAGAGGWKEINRRCKVIDDDSYVVHPFKPHVSNLQDVICSDNGARGIVYG